MSSDMLLLQGITKHFRSLISKEGRLLKIELTEYNGLRVRIEGPIEVLTKTLVGLTGSASLGRIRRNCCQISLSSNAMTSLLD